MGYDPLRLFDSSILRLLFLSSLLLVLAGCARLPMGGGGSQGKRIVFTMVLDGEVNENFVYIIPIRVSNDVNPTGDGPKPVVQPPWGNGFVGGNATHFVRWEPARPLPFILYRFNDASLLNYTEIGILENFDAIPQDDPLIEQPDRKVVRFEVPVNNLADTPAMADLLETAQINFLTMERLGSGTSGRAWDALGNGALPSEINSWVTFTLRTAAIYNNSGFNFIEPQFDDVQSDPGLDIRDWQVEVRLQ